MFNLQMALLYLLVVAYILAKLVAVNCKYLTLFKCVNSLYFSFCFLKNKLTTETGHVRHRIVYRCHKLNYLHGFMKFIRVYANLLTSRLEIYANF